MSQSGSPIFAVIGVWRDGLRTFYVKRSALMANYPGVWSLVSVQHASDEMRDPADLDEASRHFERLSRERLGGAPCKIARFLTSGSSDLNPMNVDVTLKLYEIEFEAEPSLNPDFYEAGRWMTAAEYEAASAGQPCGLCTRLWGDFAWMAGIADRPFIPRPPVAAN